MSIPVCKCEESNQAPVSLLALIRGWEELLRAAFPSPTSLLIPRDGKGQGTHLPQLWGCWWLAEPSGHLLPTRSRAGDHKPPYFALWVLLAAPAGEGMDTAARAAT